MISIRASRAAKASSAFTCLPRQKPKENNLSWLRRAAPKAVSPVRVLLLGGRSVAHLRVRVAQSHARSDLAPSHWSHVVLLTGEQAGFEVPLCDARRIAFPPESNATQAVNLRAYDDAGEFPNIALIGVPLQPLAASAPPDAKSADEPSADPVQRIKSLVKRFRFERPSLDAVELLSIWQAFLWGVARAGNPLLEGYGVPAAAFAEYVLAAAGADLTPGLGSRSSCPEAIWQSAKWWHRYHEREGRQPMTGAWNVSHPLVE